MSLFGTSPEESTAAASKSRLSLFEDDTSTAGGSKSSLFADDDDTAGGSPWAMPTPKKAARGDLIRNLLPASDVPESYVDTFDNVLNGGDESAGRINAEGVDKVLVAAGLDIDDQNRIKSIVYNGEPKDLGRNEFNVLLALVGLAQENEDITLDGVDERRRSMLSNARTSSGR
jgi:sorting nexin-8